MADTAVADNKIQEKSGSGEAESKDVVSVLDSLKREQLVKLNEEEQQIHGSLSGRQKCAILLTMVGEELASAVFNHLDEVEIEEVTLGLTSMKQIPKNVTIKILEEFYNRLVAQEYLGVGGVDYARNVLAKALGSAKANEIINRILSCSRTPTSFGFMKETDISQILYLVQNEHPQVIALLVSYMKPRQAGAFISALPQELQAEIAQRVALLTSPSPDIVSKLQSVLGRNIVTAQKQEQVGGIESVVKVINQLDRSTEKSILRELSIRDPELAEEINSRLFVFEDITEISDQHIQLVIREVEMKELAMALKGVDKNLYDTFARNMSERARAVLDEEMESLGRMKLKIVEEAQKKIVKRIKKLEEEGLIDLTRGGEAVVD